MRANSKPKQTAQSQLKSAIQSKVHTYAGNNLKNEQVQKKPVIQSNVGTKIKSTVQQSQNNDGRNSVQNNFRSLKPIPISYFKQEIQNKENEGLTSKTQKPPKPIAQLPNILPTQKLNMQEFQQQGKSTNQQSKPVQVNENGAQLVTVDQIQVLESKISMLNKQIGQLVNVQQKCQNDQIMQEEFQEGADQIETAQQNFQTPLQEEYLLPNGLNEMKQSQPFTYPKEDYQINSEETLSWLLSSVDYGKIKKSKIKSILRKHQETNLTQNSMMNSTLQRENEVQSRPHNQLSTTLSKITKLFNFFNVNEDPEIKEILQEEIDRLLRDSQTMALQFEASIPSQEQNTLRNLQYQTTACQEQKQQLLQKAQGQNFADDLMDFQKIQVREFKTEFRNKKRKRRELYQLKNDAEEHQWLSFSSSENEFNAQNQNDSKNGEVKANELNQSKKDLMINQTDVKARYKKFFNFHGNTELENEVVEVPDNIMMDSRGKIRILNFDQQ
eukprot:403369082